MVINKKYQNLILTALVLALFIGLHHVLVYPYEWLVSLGESVQPISVWIGSFHPVYLPAEIFYKVGNAAIILIVVCKLTGLSLYDMGITYKLGKNGFKKDLWVHVKVFVITWVVMILTVNLLHQFFGVTATQILEQFDPYNNQGNRFPFTAHFAEEIIFRGVMITLLLRGGLNWFWAILISSVVFSLVHINGRIGAPVILRNTLIMTELLGLLCGYLFYKTRTIVGSVYWHALVNFLITLFVSSPKIFMAFFDKVVFMKF